MKSMYKLLSLLITLLLWLGAREDEAKVIPPCTAPWEEKQPALSKPGANANKGSKQRGPQADIKIPRICENYLSENTALRDELKQREEDIKSLIEADALSAPKRFPQCLYQPLCTETVSMAKHWVVTSPDGDNNKRCWNIQPVRWASCTKSSDCNLPMAPGVEVKNYLGCRPWLIRRKLWVCCTDPKNPVHQMEINVPETCQAWSYGC